MLGAEGIAGIHPTIKAVPELLSNSSKGMGASDPFSATYCVAQTSSPLVLWHLVSLDAPTVAVVWTLAFAKAAQVQLPAWVPALLGLATWSVYVGDRLLDARAALQAGRFHCLRERHGFHWRHSRVLIPLAVCAACAALGIVLALMPPLALERNSVLAAATLAYFTGVHSPRRTPDDGHSKPLSRMAWLFSKEFLVAVLFTAGCALPVFSRIATWQLPPLAGMAAYFALLAWLNCFAIQSWESGEEIAGLSRVQRLACLLGMAGAGLAFPLFWVMPRIAPVLVTGAASALLLALLDRTRGRFSPVMLRACSDLVLLTPLALLLR